MTPDRICCDGRCVEARACPVTANQRTPAQPLRLAPGVIEGPFYSPSMAAAWLQYVDRLGKPWKRGEGRK